MYLDDKIAKSMKATTILQKKIDVMVSSSQKLLAIFDDGFLILSKLIYDSGRI